MADPLSILGVVYPIAHDLFTLASYMNKAYKGIRYAKQDLQKVIKRTEAVAETYEFFSDTMKDAKGIEGSSPILAQLVHSNKPLDSPSTFDSGSPSTSPVSNQPSPIITPSPPLRHSGGDQAFVVEPQAGETSFSRRNVPRRRRTRSEPPQKLKLQMKEALRKEYMSETEKKKAHTCKYHFLDHQNFVFTRVSDNVLRMIPTRPAVDMTSKKIVPGIMESPIHFGEDKKAPPYQYMATMVRWLLLIKRDSLAASRKGKNRADQELHSYACVDSKTGVPTWWQV
ncbi:hypothetical protein TSTA_029400 [Talaromyces stipitatus ATCC 10500]|uniref:Uncharacterized protein n=1 Tax=Talaromyces stipitatus (strain ATCC 10500 / CBS 375.48 / QM 6759 / NRRL 1006) TaxID=441959 RepID=B8M559_TALSN|nr:uncharacterized protein TSTA_029400 [Talaromyces stipitatus ATCC 10500]EED19665.1 hypothetical protein TSTA_029400 [Talaromyces stipitatus ATCC 10500]